MCTGDGPEDAVWERRLLSRGTPGAWGAGAPAYPRPPRPATPPVDHLDDLLRNGAHYAERWGDWPAPGWFEQFERMGLVRRRGDGWEAAAPTDPH